jgi:3-(3-hydroxy-phenyl)propionate hydroxylase
VFADGRRLDDRLGYRFGVIVDPALAATARNTAGARAIVVPADAAPLRDWLHAYGAPAVLLRPDRQVAGTAADAAGLAALLQRRLPEVPA